MALLGSRSADRGMATLGPVFIWDWHIESEWWLRAYCVGQWWQQTSGSEKNQQNKPQVYVIENVLQCAKNIFMKPGSVFKIIQDFQWNEIILLFLNQYLHIAYYEMD